MYIETASMATNNTNANLGPILPDPPLHQEEPVHWWFDGLNLIMLLNIVVVLLSLITAGCLWFGIKYCKKLYRPEREYDVTYHRRRHPPAHN